MPKHSEHRLEQFRRSGAKRRARMRNDPVERERARNGYRKWWNAHKNDPAVKAKQRDRDRQRKADLIEYIKRKARWVLRQAMLTGKIKKKPCEKCGNLKSEAHHTNYARPLVVNWLCRFCHAKEDHKMRSCGSPAN